MNTMTDTITLSLGEAGDLCLRILCDAGLARKHAEAVAAVIRMPLARTVSIDRCAHAVATGRVNKAAKPTVIDWTPSIVKVDAYRPRFRSLLFPNPLGEKVVRTSALATCARPRRPNFISDCHTDNSGHSIASN